MKKIIITIMLAIPMLASAQKFGHINTQELFSQMPEVNQVKLKMDTVQSQYENQLASMNEEFQKKVQEMQQRIQLFYQTAEQDIQKKQQELLAPVHEKMTKAIKAVAAPENYTYIFDSAAMVHIGADAVDATPAVKKELGIK